MSHPRVAALQMVSTNNLQENLQQAQQLIARAAEQGAALIVLPETFAMFSAREQLALGRREVSAEPPLQQFIAEQAQRHGVWIVAGTIPLADGEDEQVFAASLVFDDQGREVGRYYKMHLFDVNVADQHGSYRESDTFKHGSQPLVVDSPVGRLGVAVCYDIRFPELFRIMLQAGVDVVAVPAAFTLHTGEAHWLPLLRARAIETQCYIIGANQGGTHGKRRRTSGGSVIIDPWGTVLAEAPRGESFVLGEVDPTYLQRIRRDMPIVDHIRFETSAKH